MFCRRRIIEAVYLSLMDYSDVIYMHATASPLKPLDAVYHSALRFITGDVYSAHHCILYIKKKLGWPSLSKRRDGCLC